MTNKELLEKLSDPERVQQFELCSKEERQFYEKIGLKNCKYRDGFYHTWSVTHKHANFQYALTYLIDKDLLVFDFFNRCQQVNELIQSKRELEQFVKYLNTIYETVDIPYNVKSNIELAQTLLSNVIADIHYLINYFKQISENYQKRDKNGN